MMTITQQSIMISFVVAGTLLTRFLPFMIFKPDKPTPKHIKYLGYVLPPAVFGLLVVYSLKNVTVTSLEGFLPELLAIGLIIILHWWRRSMLLSIAGGTVFYMFLVQGVF